MEAALLVEARDCEVASRLGYVSLEEFVERHLGYGRHAANERVRVAYELEALPLLRAAHEAGRLSFSHVRELTRVATPQTEGAYLAAAAGKTSRQVQQLVSGKRAGDAPEAPPDPALVKHTIVLELGGEAFAMWRRAQQQLEIEVGERLSTDELVMQLCTQAFAPVVPDVAVAGAYSRADGDGPLQSRGTDPAPRALPVTALMAATIAHAGDLPAAPDGARRRLRNEPPPMASVRAQGLPRPGTERAPRRARSHRARAVDGSAPVATLSSRTASPSWRA